MSSVLPLSVVVPWRDRREIAETLERNQAAFAAAGAEVIVVACGGDVGWLARCLLDGPLDQRSLVVLDGAERFNKALALNLGVHHARRDGLLLLDADVVVEPDTLPLMLDRLQRGRQFVTVAEVVESDTDVPDPPDGLASLAWSIEITDREGRSVRVETNRVDLTRGTRSAPGLVLVARTDYVGVGGMHSGLEGWGWEDVDLLVRLGLAGGCRRAQAGRVRHLSHPDSARAGDARHHSEAANRDRALANYARGDYRGTYDHDCTTWADRMRRYA